MARPRTPIGTFGDISYIKASGGRVPCPHALSGRRRPGTARLRDGATQKEAERNLKGSLAERSSYQSTGELTPNSSFTTLVDAWLADLDLEGKVARARAPSTSGTCGSW